MASITIRGLEDSLKTKLRVRAASRGVSMEEEAREILKVALATQPAKRLNLAELIRQKIEPLGGVELSIPKRKATPRPILFGK